MSQQQDTPPAAAPAAPPAPTPAPAEESQLRKRIESLEGTISDLQSELKQVGSKTSEAADDLRALIAEQRASLKAEQERLKEVEVPANPPLPPAAQAIQEEQSPAPPQQPARRRNWFRD